MHAGMILCNELLIEKKPYLRGESERVEFGFKSRRRHKI
jgi:hypothetical protein